MEQPNAAEDSPKPVNADGAKLKGEKEMKHETTRTLIADGRLTAQGYDFVTEDGTVIRRVCTGKRGSTERWQRDGESRLYRSLMEAYYRA